MKIFSYLLLRIKASSFKRMMRLADHAARQREWSIAARHYKAAVELRPDASWAWVQYGHVLKESNSLEEAASAYQMAVSQNPMDEETHYYLADLLRRLGRERDVEPVLRKALQISRNKGHSQGSLFVLLNRAKAEIAIFGQTQGAEDQFERVLNDFPSQDVLVQYGHTLKDWGRHAEAEAKYLRALELSPRNADTYVHLGHSLKLQGRREAAIGAYRIACNLSEATDQAHRHAREELEQLGASHASEVHMPLDLESGPHGDTLLSLMKERNWTGLADKLVAIPAEARTAQISEFTAQVLIMIGDHAKAYSILESLTVSGYASETTFLIMARDRETKGDLPEAVDLYCNALALGMRFGEAFEALVRLNEHARIFAAIERHIFPRAGQKRNLKNYAIVPAAGRTPGLLMPEALAHSLHAEISEQANQLDAMGYGAQARLFRDDAAHLAI